MRFLRYLIPAIAAAVLVSVGPASAAEAESREALHKKVRAMRTDMFQLVNGCRRNNHLRPLKINWQLSSDALRHSRAMARRHTVFHTPHLGSVVARYHPRTWGENVGMAGTLRRVQSLFMGSAPHRANVLNRGFKRVGVGVIRSGGGLWVTLDFYG